MPYIVARFPRDEIVKIDIRSASDRMQENQYVRLINDHGSYKGFA